MPRRLLHAKKVQLANAAFRASEDKDDGDARWWGLEMISNRKSMAYCEAVCVYATVSLSLAILI